MTRRQFSSAVHLDDVLRRDLKLDLESAQSVLEDVVSRTGAEFVAHHLPPGLVDAWKAAAPDDRLRFAEAVTSCFFNAEVEVIDIGSTGISFNVTRCRFAELALEIDRPYLAPLFCAADSVFFGCKGTPDLLRTQTLASGGNHCDFRITYPD